MNYSISRQKAIEILERIHDWPEGWDADQDSAFDMAIEALSVDVVRCKDCKHYIPEEDRRCDVIQDFDVPEMFFCGNGERGKDT